MQKFDVIVIGGGPGGYVAAIRSAQLGKKTAIIEKDKLGGICLNWGCIPTKSLLKSAHLYELMKHSDEYGIFASDVKFDIQEIVKKSEKISGELVKGIGSLVKKNKITLIEGHAKFKDKNTLIIDNREEYQADNIIIATGARARIINGFEPNGKNIWSYREALKPKSLPKSIIIVGSGAIGIEFASFYNSLGSEVTILEGKERILNAEDGDISNIARKIFEEKNIKFETNVKLISQTSNDENIIVEFEKNGVKTSLKSEILLMAVGITGNIEELNLEKIGLKTEKNHIIIDKYCESSVNNIYAIGDVAGAPWLAHKASHEGMMVAQKIAGNKVHLMDKNNIPACTYSNPQIASVGMSEEKAKQAGFDVRIGNFPSYANAKSLIMNDKKGIVKTIFDRKTGELLGAHMIGVEVTELIQGYVIAKQMEGTEDDLINTIFPHPTLSEKMHESVLDAYDRAIHI